MVLCLPGWGLPLLAQWLQWRRMRGVLSRNRNTVILRNKCLFSWLDGSYQQRKELLSVQLQNFGSTNWFEQIFVWCFHNLQRWSLLLVSAIDHSSHAHPVRGRDASSQGKVDFCRGSDLWQDCRTGHAATEPLGTCSWKLSCWCRPDWQFIIPQGQNHPGWLQKDSCWKRQNFPPIYWCLLGTRCGGMERSARESARRSYQVEVIKENCPVQIKKFDTNPPQRIGDPAESHDCSSGPERKNLWLKRNWFVSFWHKCMRHQGLLSRSVDSCRPFANQSLSPVTFPAHTFWTSRPGQPESCQLTWVWMALWNSEKSSIGRVL